jgi:hypothetical protein
VEKEIAIRQAAAWIRDVDGLLITAGAGMGGDSGPPDFRGTEGFWRAYTIPKTVGLGISAGACEALGLLDNVLSGGA